MLRSLFCALAAFPLAHAWTFLYTNATGNATILHQTETVNCTKIDLAKGKEFSWDPEGADLCISIYYDKSCTSRGGLSCGAWKKDSGNDYDSIQVFTNDDASSTSVSSSPTSIPTTATSTASKTETPTSTTTISSTMEASSSTGSSKSSLSGGAIAGIVIGVIVAICIIGATLFYAGRRNRKDASSPSVRSSWPHPPYSPTLVDMQTAMPPHEFAFASFEKTPPPSRGRPVPGSKLVELPGSGRSVEIGNSPVSEMSREPGDMRFNRI